MIDLYRKYKEIVNYVIFGVLTTVVNIVVYYIAANVLSIHYLVSNALAWILSVLFAYITNRKYVFESHSKSIFSEMTKFFGARLATGILDMVCMWLFISLLNINGVISKIVANIIVIVANYILSKLFVFRKEA